MRGKKVGIAIALVAIAGGCLDFDLALHVCEDGGRCSSATDAGGVDASVVDAAPPLDAGPPDAASVGPDAAHDGGLPSLDAAIPPDAATSALDAGLKPDAAGADAAPPPDAGGVDSGAPGVDAGGPDAGPDAGTVACGVVTAVQAIPGTTEGQVIVNKPALAYVIDETAGNLLVVVAYGGQGNIPDASTAPNMTFTVTDTALNTYYPGPMFENGNSHQAALQIFYAPNINGGPNVVTVTSSGDPSLNLWTGLFLQEYSGIATSNVVDISSGQMAPASSTVTFPGSMRTSTCDLVVGAFVDGAVSGQNLNAGTGWGFRSTDDWDPGACVDDAPTGAPPGSVVDAVISMTGGPDDGWVATQMAFRASGTSALPQPNQIGFTTAKRTVTGSACSAAVTVESLLGTQPTNTATGIRMTLSGATLTFYIDASCAYPITNLLIGAGMNSQTFYFKASASGTPTITVTPAAATGMATITQMETAN